MFKKLKLPKIYCIEVKGKKVAVYLKADADKIFKEINRRLEMIAKLHKI